MSFFLPLLQNKGCLNKRLFSQRVHSLEPLCSLTSLYYTLNNCIADDDVRRGGWETVQRRHRHNTPRSKQTIWPIHMILICKTVRHFQMPSIARCRPYLIEKKNIMAQIKLFWKSCLVTITVKQVNTPIKRSVWNIKKSKNKKQCMLPVGF